MRLFAIILFISFSLIQLSCSKNSSNPVDENEITGGWQKIPVLSESVNCVESDMQGNLWIGTSSGIFVSSNKGETWSPRFTGLGSDEILKIKASADGKIYAASETALYLYNTTNSQWINISNNIETNLISYLHRLHSFNTDFRGDIYAGMFISEQGNPSEPGQDHSAYFKSSNSGVSWERIIVTQFQGPITHTAFNSSHDIFIVMDAQVYKSSDEGNTWTFSNTGLNWSDPNMIKENSNGILFAATGDGIFKSANDGANWTKTAYSTLTLSIVINPQDKIFISAINKCLVSDDDVESTSDFSEGLEHSISGFSDCVPQAIDPQGFVYATLEGVLYRTTNSTIN